MFSVQEKRNNGKINEITVALSLHLSLIRMKMIFVGRPVDRHTRIVLAFIYPHLRIEPPHPTSNWHQHCSLQKRAAHPLKDIDAAAAYST
jgi:hypothetical protein